MSKSGSAFPYLQSSTFEIYFFVKFIKKEKKKKMNDSSSEGKMSFV